MPRALRLAPVLALLGALACRPVPAEISPVAATPELAPPEIEPDNRALTCGPDVLAIIGDEALSMAGFDLIFALKQRKYADRGREMPASAEGRYRKSISDRLIYLYMLELEMARAKLSYDPDALAQRQNDATRGIEDWDAHLRRRGENEATLRALYIGELCEHSVLDARGDLSVGAEEIQAEYDKIAPNYDKDADRVRASHILIEIDPERPGRATRAEAKAEAERILAEARKPGADFRELAQRESDGPSNSRGGDLGIFTANRMVEDFSKPVFQAKPGDILMTETKFGFHVVWIEDRYGPGRLPLSALEDDIRERLEARKLHERRRGLKAELMDAYEPRNCELERLEAAQAAAAIANR